MSQKRMALQMSAPARTLRSYPSVVPSPPPIELPDSNGPCDALSASSTKLNDWCERVDSILSRVRR